MPQHTTLSKGQHCQRMPLRRSVLAPCVTFIPIFYEPVVSSNSLRVNKQTGAGLQHADNKQGPACSPTKCRCCMHQANTAVLAASNVNPREAQPNTHTVQLRTHTMVLQINQMQGSSRSPAPVPSPLDSKAAKQSSEQSAALQLGIAADGVNGTLLLFWVQWTGPMQT